MMQRQRKFVNADVTSKHVAAHSYRLRDTACVSWEVTTEVSAYDSTAAYHNTNCNDDAIVRTELELASPPTSLQIAFAGRRNDRFMTSTKEPVLKSSPRFSCRLLACMSSVSLFSTAHHSLVPFVD